MPHSLKDLEEFKSRAVNYAEVAMEPESITSEVSKIITFLEASQYGVIQLMQHNSIWKGPLPPDPGGKGELEFGLLPHWLAEPPDFIQDFLDKHDWLKDIWNTISFFVPNQIDEDNYDNLMNAVKDGGVVAEDGTMFGTEPYEQLDPHWVWSAVDYLIVHFGHDRADFSGKQVKPISLEGKSSDQVTIALLGDWGTGDATALGIMAQIIAMQPDYIVHLGDVYYAGTPGTDHLFRPPNEEQDNFLNCWPTAEQQKPGTSFTLNSNHEMYSGAKGLFDVALADSRFSAQQCTSYFALQYAGWTLLGLDTGFYSSSPLYMVGAIGVGDDPQPGWIQGLNLSPDKVIVLSHYNGLTYDGSSEPRYPDDSQTTFWDQMNAALGGDPAAWYWGHIHDGIVYDTPTVTKRKTLARCLGHAAIPYGNPWGIEENPGQVIWHEKTPNPSLGPRRVKNGFAMLTIKSDGSVTEDFFEQDNPTSVYCNCYVQASE